MLLTAYLRDFNREYLSTPANRRRTARETLKFLILAAAFVLAAWIYGFIIS